MEKSSHTNKEINLYHLLKISVCLLSLLPLHAKADFDHAEWDGLLREHVTVIDGGIATQLDYSGIAAERVVLKD